MSGMTKLPEDAITKVRELPAEDQDAVAMLSMADLGMGPNHPN